MRLLRQPTRAVLLWTMLCAVPVSLLIADTFADTGHPPNPLCVPNCDWSDYDWFATGVFVLLISAMWLVVTALIIWLWRRSH